MTTLSFLVWIVWAVAGFAILYKMAASRGRHPLRWGVFGAVTFVIALIALLVAGTSDDFEPQET